MKTPRFRWILGFMALSLLGTVRAEPTAPAVTVSVQSTLRSATGHIRQFVFDGDPQSYFASTENATGKDEFSMILSAPITAKSIQVVTGRPDGGDKLTIGTLEFSADGKSFETVAKFAEGVAEAKEINRKLLAIRIRPGEDLKHPLVIREIKIESDPPVAVFKYPVEIAVNSDDAPEMKPWLEKVARICEQQYPMICEELRSDGFKARTSISMTLKNDYNGVAATGGGRITGAVKYFKTHQDDIGAMVHETVHAVQSYRTRNNPGWLVEGIADYIRFFKYEPGKLRPLPAERARYNGSYQVTARFLAFVTEKHDKEIVRKLNKAMREGEYREDIWKELTKKTLPELEAEWKESLRK